VHESTKKKRIEPMRGEGALHRVTGSFLHLFAFSVQSVRSVCVVSSSAVHTLHRSPLPGTATAARAGSNNLKIRIERIERMKKRIDLVAATGLCSWEAVFLWLATEATEVTALYTPAVAN
jgi:hypothetical protein